VPCSCAVGPLGHANDSALVGSCVGVVGVEAGGFQLGS
jgi:hypothetical protein